MSGQWRYRDIVLEIQAVLIYAGQHHTIPMYGGESLEHAMFKVSIAAHLLTWGYRWERIHWEKTPAQGPQEFRPDLYTEGDERLPSFWFECVSTEQEKLIAIITALPNFRVVRVVDCDWFTRLWNGEDISLEEVKDMEKYRELIVQERESLIPPRAECWAMRSKEGAPRIIYAVRRESDNRFVFLDAGEGWSLSALRYVSKRKGCFSPLIPGLVGSDQWKGENPELLAMRLEA